MALELQKRELAAIDVNAKNLIVSDKTLGVRGFAGPNGLQPGLNACDGYVPVLVEARQRTRRMENRGELIRVGLVNGVEIGLSNGAQFLNLGVDWRQAL